MTTLGTSVLYGKTLIFSLDKLAYKTSVLLFTFHSNNFFIFTFIRQKMRDFLSHSLFVFICCTLSIVQAIYYAPVVRVRNGRVRGELETVPYSTPVFAYKGIPYAQAKRFEKAVWPKSWAGVLNATHFRDACPQPDLEPTSATPFGLPVSSTTTSMSEDCLFLSVYRPRPNFVHDVMLGGMIIPMRKVMVYFVGNGPRSTIFSKLADASYLSSRGDVVVVTVQSRVGPFGYLYGGTNEAPGNVGLHDQILALRWIWYNIGTFSGDRTQVTIFGDGVSIGSMILSPLNWRLFKRAIIQSGSPLSPVYGATSKKKALEKTYELAKKLDCTTTTTSGKRNINSTMDCLRSKSVEEIVTASKDGFSHNALFTPIYGDDLLPVKPSKAFAEGKFNLFFDLLYGTTKDEGADFVSLFVPESETSKLTVESVKETLRWMMLFYGENYGDEVADFYTSEAYLNESSTKEDMRTVISTAWSDYAIVCPTILFAERYASRSPRHYYYAYRLDQPFSFAYNLDQSSENETGSESLDYLPRATTVHHGSELMYLFAGNTDKRFTKAESKLSSDMHYAWTSFAKNGWVRGWYGKIAWAKALDKPLEPVTKVISLNSENYKMMPALYQDSCGGFWAKKLLEKKKSSGDDE